MESYPLRNGATGGGWNWTGPRGSKLNESAVDLGAHMVYGKRNYLRGSRPFEQREAVMGPSSAPSCRRVEESIWAKAFYGCSNSPLGKSHIQELRAATVKSLRRNRAGANPVLALSLQDSMASDPGFYQLWTALSTLRRA